MREDSELLERARRGETEAFGELVRRHQGACLATARHLLGDREAGRETVQEAFLKAWASLESYRGGGSFRSWLFAIVRNLCRDRGRRRSRRPVLVDLETAPPQGRRPEAGDGLLREEQRQALEEALEGLTDRQRLALELRCLDGCSSEEIGAALGCAASTARVTIHQARRKALAVLERHLRDRGIPEEKARETLLGN